MPMNRLEYYGVLNQPGMHHLASFLAHGVFDRFPGLRVLVLETGLNWFPWIVWQLDGHFETLRRENPWLSERPSTYLRRHVRLSTQRMEPGRRPMDQAELLGAVDGIEEMIVFSTDYPHWDADQIDYVSRHFPREWLPALFHDNALALFGWDA
jgi:predicted TIM-barrel fold metal-dependent hydrolase